MYKLFSIARPYSRAAFIFALEHKKIKHWQSMLEYLSFISKNKKITQLISRKVSPKILFKIFSSICYNTLDQYGKNFVYIMAQNKRLCIFPIVLQQFVELRATLESKININITSSFRLNKIQKNKIISLIEARILKKIILKCKIDKSILGGIIIHINNIVIDGSIRSRLDHLTDILKS
ncbi:ATP synthase subunit delta [Candidatus Ecksteinia adelgidicola]|nr:ATP synthase subunit delta [Candidatus Ecksteinia adelgidicola]